MLQPGDIFLVHGNGFVANAIRFFTRRFGERRSEISHVGIIVSSGDVQHAMVVEALGKVRWVPFSAHIGQTLEVYRPMNLTQLETERIVSRAMSYIGRPYGYIKILAHVLDSVLLGARVFRRLAGADGFPICSWLVAHAYLAAGKDFGVPAGVADPDDIGDFVENHPDKYMQIHSLRPLTEGEFNA